MKRIVILLFLFAGICPLYAQVREISANEFFYTLLPKMTRPIAIDFWAEWCGPCHRYTPTFRSVAFKNKSRVDFYRVNIDKNEEWYAKWEIESIPITIIVYNKSCEFVKKEGILDHKILQDMIEECVKIYNSDDEPYF